MADDGRAEIDAAIARYLERVAVAIEADAKAGCPVKTGRLANSITHEMSDDGKTARIGTNVDYALPTEFGSRPHRIYPKRPGGMLNFYWERLGQDVTLPFVRHPGTPEQPFLRPALFRQRGAL
jgi:phage gpG-like protein